MRSRDLPALIAGLGLLACTSPGGTLVNDDDTPAPDASPPSGMEIAISPAAPTSSEDFVVQVTSEPSDPDGDLAEVLYVWRVDGVPRDDLSGVLTIGANLTLRGELWSVSATAVDAGGRQGPMTTASVTIGNSAPGAPVVAIDPAEPLVAQDSLLCLVTTDAPDADGDAVEYSVAWEVNGQPYPRTGDTGPSTTTLPDDTVPAGDPGPAEEWLCRVTPADGTEQGDPGEATVWFDLGPPVADFSLVDVNATSATFEQQVSPRDYLEAVSGWYFGHAT